MGRQVYRGQSWKLRHQSYQPNGVVRNMFIQSWHLAATLRYQYTYHS